MGLHVGRDVLGVEQDPSSDAYRWQAVGVAGCEPGQSKHGSGADPEDRGNLPGAEKRLDDRPHHSSLVDNLPVHVNRFMVPEYDLTWPMSKLIRYACV